MNKKDFVDYMKVLATRHKIIAHNAAIVGGGNRLSFFVNEEQLSQALGKQVNYPYLIVPPFTGRMENTGVIQNHMFCSFEVRKQWTATLDFEERTQLEADCYDIGQQLIAFMSVDALENGVAGPIPNFNENNITYEYTGPVGDNEVGCRFTIAIEDDAYNPYSFDIDEYFNN